MRQTWQRGAYTISTDRSLLDLDTIHQFLAHESYWAQAVPLDVIRRSIEHSLAFGVYHGEQQIGFARVVTDYATFAWISDVFILESARGQGLGVWLIETIRAHPELQGLRRWMLATRDAHMLYAKVGFAPLATPDRFMELRDPKPYGQGGDGGR